MTSTRTRLLALGMLLLQAAFLCVAADSPTQANKIPVGLGMFEYHPDATQPQRRLKVWTCRPESCGPESPIVFVMHGVKRNGEGYRNNWASHSRQQGFLLLVPEFPEAEYSGESYAQGNLRDRAGRPVARDEWTFTVIERLFEHAKALTGSRVAKYHLYGHSAGGQFVHRFVLFMPEARYARAIAANPGYYTVPTQQAPYPYGLKGTHLTGPLGPAVFARDFVLLLGLDDTNRDDPNLRKTPAADAQGLNRLERGKNYYQTAKRIAGEAKAAFDWKVVYVPGVGHSDAKMSSAAARELFAKRP